MIIDVSEYNGKLNWEKIKPQIEGAIIRCGFGSDYTKQDDAYFKRNVSECERLGIPFGVYIYSYANTTAKAKSEANHVKRLVKGLNLAFPIFYDLEEERYSKYAKSMANTWLSEMDGYDVGIYANVNWWKNYLNGISCKKWVAYWGKTKPSLSNMVLWQYSSTGKLSGVSGQFDLNENISMPIPQPIPPEPANEKAGVYIVTANSGLNLRSHPNGTVITCMKKNSQVECFGEYSEESDGLWLKVNFNGKIGWSFAKWLSKYSDYDSSKAGIYTNTTIHGLNMRETAGKGNVIKCMEAGSECISKGFYKNVNGTTWLRITQGETGWSSADWLRKL